MTYFIGGNSSGQVVGQNELDLRQQRVPRSYGPHTGMQRPQEFYIRTGVSHEGTSKTFYIIEGSKPIDHRDQILKLWDEVKTDIYAI